MGRPPFLAESTTSVEKRPQVPQGNESRDCDAPRPIPDAEHKPRAVRLPGLVSDQEIGLGDAIKRMTSALGVQPCGGCQRRATLLNRWVVFTGRR